MKYAIRGISLEVRRDHAVQYYESFINDGGAYIIVYGIKSENEERDNLEKIFSCCWERIYFISYYCTKMIMKKRANSRKLTAESNGFSAIFL